MEERFAVRSRVALTFVLVIAALSRPTLQKPICKSPEDCVGNALGSGDEQPRGFYSKYLSAVEDPAVMKRLMEALLMQHNEYADDNTGDEENENSTERPPTRGSAAVDFHQSKPGDVSTGQRPENINDHAKDDHPTDAEENSTERPPIERFTDVADGGHEPLEKDSNENFAPSSSGESDSQWETTTVEPQQLASPLDVGTRHFETTTIQPTKSVYPTRPPATSKKPKRTTTTERPPADIRPPKKTVPKNRRKPSPTHDDVKKTNSPVDQDNDLPGLIQFEGPNGPISTRKPLPTNLVAPVSATGSRPNKKPINVLPESGAAGSGNRNPSANPDASSEPDDYLTAALASIADDDDGDDDDEGEDEDEDEGEGEEEEDEKQPDEEEDEEEEEEDYLTDSAEETEERENFSGIDAGDVISSVMEEVGALI